METIKYRCKKCGSPVSEIRKDLFQCTNVDCARKKAIESRYFTGELPEWVIKVIQIGAIE